MACSTISSVVVGSSTVSVRPDQGAPAASPAGWIGGRAGAGGRGSQGPPGVWRGAGAGAAGRRPTESSQGRSGVDEHRQGERRPRVRAALRALRRLRDSRRLPTVRQQFVEPVCGPPACELAEHVREVGQGWDAVLGAGAHQAIEIGGSPRCVVRAREEVVLPPERDVAQLLFTQRMPRARLCRVGERTRPAVRDLDLAALVDAA